MKSLSQSDRADGRLLRTADFVHYRLKHVPPRLAFNPDIPARLFNAWQQRVRRKLRQLMTFPFERDETPPRLIDEQPRHGYVLQRWELYPEPRSVLPVLLLVPDTATAAAPGPAVLCLPGSEQPKEALAGEQWTGNWRNKFGEHNFMALHFVRRGMVALAMDNPGTAELEEPRVTDWRRQSLELIWLGRSYEALSVFHKRTALAWLRRLPTVDRHRIAVCGHSLGAKPALILGVLEPQVRAVVWNDNASGWRAREVARNLSPVAPWHYVPGFADWFDYMDLMCALAPRPLLVTEGGRAESLKRIRRAYRLAGAPGGFKVSYMPNFKRAADRVLDREPMPEGLDAEAYARYANYDSDHYFKEDVAVPWVERMLREPRA